MTNCIVCKQKVEKYKVSLRIEAMTPPRDETDVMAELCPNCGVMTIVPAGTDHLRNHSKTGFEVPTQEEIRNIDIEALFDEISVPRVEFNERIVWIDPEFDVEIREDYWYETFKDGYPTEQPKYVRLINFLMMDKQERIDNFGPLEATSIKVNPGGVFTFNGGFHRFCIFRYLGAKRIPVSMTPKSIEQAEENGRKIYNSR